MLFIATVVLPGPETIVDSIEADTIQAATLGAEMEYPNASMITVEEDQHS
jgi:hypothetical protein